MDMVGYVRKEKRGFDALPLNNADLLVFAWVAYVRFSFVSDMLPITLEEVGKLDVYKTFEPFNDTFTANKSRALWRALGVSPRFKDVKIIDLMERIDKKEIVQFVSLAYELDDCVIVAIKGTSPAFIGWQEDFVLAYQMSIASYHRAEEFMDRVVTKTDKPIKLIGHSKGGHVAAYLLCRSEHRDRIESCYSFEGPGFRDKEIIKMLKEDTRYTKIVPSCSLVGILFSNEEDVKIVRSINLGAFQHDPFSWLIKDGDFIYLSKRSFASHRLDAALNGWIYSLTEEQRKRFSEVLFGALDSFKAQDFGTFFKFLPAQIQPLRKAYKSLNKEDRELVDEVIRRLFKYLFSGGKPDQKGKGKPKPTS